MIRELSDRTLAELLTARLRRARVIRLFTFELGPSGRTYVSAVALAPDDRVVQATALDLEEALVALFEDLDQVGTRSAPAISPPRSRPSSRSSAQAAAAAEQAVAAPAINAAGAGQPRRTRRRRTSEAEARARARRVALELLERWGSVTGERLAGALGDEAWSSRSNHVRELSEAVLRELHDAGELAASARYGYVAPARRSGGSR